eukprot:TRINITY_DN18328_c0_g2_i2.p1 TRINITY_DN18328_c0_g2~~TRINITY_DN18328_c0_g2_i2.p1  ORF type:complete len:644 (+),score=110.22 TRINITY_DN18328_c0_g2_i2:60-1934(+)
MSVPRDVNNPDMSAAGNEKRLGPPSVIVPTTASEPIDTLCKAMPPIRTTSRSRLSRVVRSPCTLAAWTYMLYGYFGGYVPAAILQYGVNQGLGMSLFNMARKVYVSRIGLDGATSGRYVAAGHMPWAIKPLFGMFSDAVPILGLRRTPYFFLGGICGIMAYLFAAIVQPEGPGIVLMLIFFNASIAMPDVMIDAVCAEQSKKSPAHASDLQSLSWGAFAFGGLIGSIASGMLVDAVGPRTLFIMGVVCPLGVVFAAGTRLLPEKRLPKEKRRVDVSWLRGHRDLVMLAFFTSTISVILSILQTITEDKQVRAAATVVAGTAVILGVYFILRRTAEVLARTAVFIVLRECLQPSTGEAMFQWLTKYEDGPKFSPTLLGWTDLFGYIGLFIGIVAYNKYCRRSSYRKIFAFAQLGMAAANLFDVALVFRWNRLVGIPDWVMLMGDESMNNAVQRFVKMPMFVLASKVCPDNVEATLFALLMSLSNFGNGIGDLLGVAVLEFSGTVNGNYDNFGWVTLSKSFFRLLPLLIIPVFIPNLTQSDPVPSGFEAEDDAPERLEESEGSDDVPKGTSSDGTNSVNSEDDVKRQTTFGSVPTGDGITLQSHESSNSTLPAVEPHKTAEPCAEP